MPSVTAYPPGVFCWPELSTTDATAATRFYGAVFDWDAKIFNLDGLAYTIFQSDGDDVCGAYTLGPAEPGGPRWNSSVSVLSADKTAARAERLGGTLLRQPFDVANVCRIAVLQDPQGASFYAWQAREHVGSSRMQEPGYLCWTELITSDLVRAETFYTQLFGWSARRFGDYVEFLRGREPVAGMLKTPPGRGAEGSHWLPYFTVNDVDGAVQAARRHFGTILGRPMDIPMVGRSAVLRDPQGATFGVFGANEAA